MESEIFQFEPTGLKCLIPARLKEAREASALSMTELAEKVGVTPQAISQYESDDKQPEWATLMRIAKHLDQPIGYFTSERPIGGDLGATIFFRSFKSRTKGTHKMLRRWGIWAAQIVRYVESYINLPEVVIPASPDQSIYTDEDIERLATECRRLWGLADGPIANMVALLESKGFIVIRASFGVDSVDAFSCWQDERPFIFLGSDKGCSVRSRFDSAHELGHMILHRHIPKDEIEDVDTLARIEHEANRFASAFLLPAKTFLSELFSSSLKQFVDLKRRWKVSVAAMIQRCKCLGVFDESQYVNLRKQLSFNKWLTREPLDDTIPLENATLIESAIKLGINSRIKTATDIVLDLNLSSHVISKIGSVDERILSDQDASPVTNLLDLKQA